MPILQAIKQFHRDLQARAARHYRTQEIVRVMQPMHELELAHTPGEQWGLVKQKQAAEIQAVRDGKFDIVDRRTWSFPYLPECVAEETEIFTRRGWIPVSDMRLSDRFATRSPDGTFEWQRASKITRSRYRGPMVHFKSIGTDLLVTPNHRMLGRPAKYWREGVAKFGRKETFVLAHDLLTSLEADTTDRFMIPTRARWVGKLPRGGTTVHIEATRCSKYSHPKSYTVDLKDWVAFLGLYVAEGSCTGAYTGMDADHPSETEPLYVQAIAAAAEREAFIQARPLRGYGPEKKQFAYAVGISQRAYNKHYGKIKELIERLPFNFHPSDAAGNDFVTRSKALWEAVAPLGNGYTMAIPRWVKELPAEYLRIFLNGYLLGDGYEYGNEYRECVTVSPQLADDLQEIFLKAGTAATRDVSVSRDWPQNRGAPKYKVYELKKSYIGVGKPTVEHYDGYVYCPTVPNGTIYVRRIKKLRSTGGAQVVASTLQNGRLRDGVGATNRGTGPASWCGNSLHRLR